MSEAEDHFICRIQLQRKEKIFMPVDLHLTMADGSEQIYRIPVEGFGCRQQGRNLLPYWHFSREAYTAEIRSDKPVTRVAIDPVLTQMDINQLDNTSGWLPDMDWEFMRVQHVAPPLNAYLWEIWPLAFYNDIDKAKLGINLKGGYLNIDHLTDLRVWFKTATLNLDLDLSYEHPVGWTGAPSWINFHGYVLDGREGGRIGIRRKLPGDRRHEISLHLGIGGHHLSDRRYLMNVWEDGWETHLDLKWENETTFDGWTPEQRLSAVLNTSTFGSDYDFSQIYIEGFRKFWDGYSDLEFDIRVFGGYGTGSLPAQYLFNLSGDNSRGEFANDFYRSRGSLPWPWRRNGNLYKAGGGNVRGYSLFRKPEALLGTRILAVNLDLKLPGPLRALDWPILRDIYPGVFFDYGKVWDRSWPEISEFDAGAGVALTWEVWDWLDYFFNMRSVRVDFPVWLNHVPAGEKPFDLRWLIRFDFD
jgi:hypothetical protein